MWDLRKGSGDVPESLSILALFIFKLSITNLLQAFVLGLIKEAPFDKNSEVYSRLTIDHLIMACFAKYKKNLYEQSELPTNDPTTTISPILEQSELPTKDPHNQIDPTTPSKTPESNSPPLPIKLFHEIPLAVQVERGNKKWVVSGIAD